jgi:hypothetical protein
MSSQDKEKDMLRQFIKKAFVTDPSLLKLLVDRIPDDEIANFQPVLYLREAFRLSVEPGKFTNIVDSLALLKNRGVDLNTPSVVTIIEPNGERDESYTLGQLVVTFGHRKQNAYNTYGNDQLYYRFIEGMEDLGVDFDWPNDDGINAYDLANAQDMDGGNGTSLFNRYMNRRALKEKLQHDLGILDADDDGTKI